MSQLAYKLADKFGKTVHKIIFTSPSTEHEGKLIEICQRYFNAKDSEMKIGKNAFPVDVKDWVRQSGNRLIQYKDFQTCLNYGMYQQQGVELKEKIDVDVGKISFYVAKKYVKPDGQVLLSRELGANKVAQVAQSVVMGAQMNAGLIVIIAVLAAGILGGALLGYFGFPQLTGQHLVPNQVG